MRVAIIQVNFVKLFFIQSQRHVIHFSSHHDRNLTCEKLMASKFETSNEVIKNKSLCALPSPDKILFVFKIFDFVSR